MGFVVTFGFCCFPVLLFPVKFGTLVSLGIVTTNCPHCWVCVCVKHLNRFKTSPFFFSSFSPSNKGCQSQSRGHGSCFPSHANEAMAFNRKGMWTHIPVPAFIFVWRGAKPRTPKTENLVLHGCRNLRFSSASYSTLFALHFYSHGEGLSRKPYSDFSVFWTLFDGVSGHDGLFGVPSIIRRILLRFMRFRSNVHVKGLSS